MNVAICSMWRDSHAYVDTALEQFRLLGKEIDKRGDHLRFVWCENDSTDDTFDRLSAFDGDVTLVRRSDGCPYFRSEERVDRWRHLAWVANATLEEITSEDDAVIYVESDLTWETTTMLRLLDHLSKVDVVSPLNMRHDGTYFDTWGSRGMDGRRFSAHPPWHPDLQLVNDRGLVEVQSMAGCTALVADVARMTRFDPADCYVGWNRAMRLAGWTVWCDPSLAVVHP